MTEAPPVAERMTIRNGTTKLAPQGGRAGAEVRTSGMIAIHEMIAATEGQTATGTIGMTGTEIVETARTANPREAVTIGESGVEGVTT